MTLNAGKAINITSAKDLGNHRIELVFSDRHSVTVNFGPFLRASFNPGIRKFLAPQEFQLFQIVHGNLVWGDYDLCFPIEDLYAGRILCSGHEPLTIAVAETAEKYTVRPKKKAEQG
jgi:hypothetical protein